VQRYVPEFEKRWGRYTRRVHSSWRMDETAVSVRGGAHYLYRAVDKYGKTGSGLTLVTGAIGTLRRAAKSEGQHPGHQLTVTLLKYPP
jgi:DDE superfamily endonuclease